jgi:iron complex transport system permease protein
MNRAGFRAIRIGRIGAGSPEGAGVPDAFALVALSLLGFGLTHGSLPVPAPPSGARCFLLKA